MPVILDQRAAEDWMNPLGKLCTGLNGAAICDSCEHFQQGKATGR
jgi:hypothetical protein